MTKLSELQVKIVEKLQTTQEPMDKFKLLKDSTIKRLAGDSPTNVKKELQHLCVCGYVCCTQKQGSERYFYHITPAGANQITFPAAALQNSQAPQANHGSGGATHLRDFAGIHGATRSQGIVFSHWEDNGFQAKLSACEKSAAPFAAFEGNVASSQRACSARAIDFASQCSVASGIAAEERSTRMRIDPSRPGSASQPPSQQPFVPPQRASAPRPVRRGGVAISEAPPNYPFAAGVITQSLVLPTPTSDDTSRRDADAQSAPTPSLGPCSVQPEPATTFQPVSPDNPVAHIPALSLDPGQPEKMTLADFDLVYSLDSGISDDTDVLDIVHAFEGAPGASGLLQVQSVHRAKMASQAKTGKELERWARDKREREEVLWQLLTASKRMEGMPQVRCARVFHGCPSREVALSIFQHGFDIHIAGTKGWYGEGIYTTTSAPYGLRYSFGMRDFWDAGGETGYVIAGRAVFAQVYPVTQADNAPHEPLVPGLKGKQIARAPGAQGCDAHCVCVRGFPSDENHQNRTYHACAEGQRPDGTELVVNQEAQLLPEFIVKVNVRDDSKLCARVRLAAETWGRTGPHTSSVTT
eukprot:CAMPEP_0115573630 /NCGR_PEP_ID=MMETSP0272-20121206/1101_1 /TAXON_ID=71861 /ORGANISM="Scrippsiella trochoidea, Strain CCMP3099" /LENGTH=582 /DNA_ID=CAMNT_0003008307 /DNA_START=15 /DNA_END=1764 /DNA_ORIENTATION=-